MAGGVTPGCRIHAGSVHPQTPSYQCLTPCPASSWDAQGNFDSPTTPNVTLSSFCVLGGSLLAGLYLSIRISAKPHPVRWGKYFCPHFTDEETRAQNGLGPCLAQHCTMTVKELGLDPQAGVSGEWFSGSSQNIPIDS